MKDNNGKQNDINAKQHHIEELAQEAVKKNEEVSLLNEKPEITQKTVQKREIQLNDRAMEHEAIKAKQMEQI